MRLQDDTDGRSHLAVSTTPHDHHSQPFAATVNNTSQVLSAGTSFNLDVTLPNANYKHGRCFLMGPDLADGPGVGLARDWAVIYISTVSSDSIGYSGRNAQGLKKSYCVTYSKQAGDARLTERIFDSTTGSNYYIALEDAWINGSVLRMTFRNVTASSRTLWVKGQIEVY